MSAARMVSPAFSVGVAGYLNASRHGATGFQLLSGREAGLDMGYAGVDLAWITRPTPRLHVTVGTLLGGGAMGYRGDRSFDTPVDGFFVAEPGVTAEVTVLSNARLGVGASYRAVSGAGLPTVTNADLRGAAASVMLKVGRF